MTGAAKIVRTLVDKNRIKMIHIWGGKVAKKLNKPNLGLFLVRNQTNDRSYSPINFQKTGTATGIIPNHVLVNIPGQAALSS